MGCLASCCIGHPDVRHEHSELYSAVSTLPLPHSSAVIVVQTAEGSITAGTC
jgi:hypothetical protein